MSVSAQTDVLILGRRVRELAVIYCGRDRWRATMERELTKGSGDVPAMVERHALKISKVLQDIKNIAARAGVNNPLVADAHLLAVRIEGSIGGGFFPAPFLEVFTQDDPGRAVYDLANIVIGKGVGQDFKEIDRLWPALAARADLMQFEEENPPPPPTESTRDSTEAPRRRGRRPDPRIRKRNKRLKELCKERALSGKWAELARVANEDPQIRLLRLDHEISPDIARNAVKPR